MSSPISRRTLAKGAAWAAPVVAATATVPAYAASSCPLTSKELAAGICDSRVSMSWSATGAQTYSSSQGAVANVNTQVNLGFVSSCNYKGSVTMKMHNNSGEKYVPAPTLTLTDGTVYSGVVTLSNVVTGGAIAGWGSTFAVQWLGAKTGKAAQYPTGWKGAKVVIPMEFSYSDNGVHICMIQLEFTMSSDYSNAAKPMLDADFVEYVG